jgi:hypothetical protein
MSAIKCGSLVVLSDGRTGIAMGNYQPWPGIVWSNVWWVVADVLSVCDAGTMTVVA